MSHMSTYRLVSEYMICAGAQEKREAASRVPGQVTER